MIDTSVWVWAGRATAVNEDLKARARAGAIATCHPVQFELLYSARNAQEYAYIRERFDRLPLIAVDHAVWERALDVNEEMARQGGMQHRQVRQPDLLIAAAAELAGIPVLHYDADYERISEITGQPTQWVRPRGSL
jgi:predicted nucleic acid-binding protein